VRPYTPAVPYELPEETSTDRRRLIWRWVSIGLVALLAGLLAYLAYVGFAGSAQAVEPPSPSRDCRTPAIAYGWTYEVINYDPGNDLALRTLDDPTDCSVQLAPAGDALVTSDGIGLAGWYIPAASEVGEDGPTVVLVHDYGGNKSSMLATAAILHDRYNLVLFDLRNHGQSLSTSSTAGLLERLDVRAVIDWLEARKHPTTIGLLGVGMGGAAAINEAVVDSRVDALVLDSTHATLANAIQARLEQQGYPLSLPGAWAVLFGGLVRTGQDMTAADPVQVAERYGADRPLLVIGGGQDRLIGSHDTQEIADAALGGGSDVQMQTCEPAGHDQSIEACSDDYRSWVLGFFDGAL
jgi:pimeloyl-ACP methyl ester carboxylesterase